MGQPACPLTNEETQLTPDQKTEWEQLRRNIEHGYAECYSRATCDKLVEYKRHLLLTLVHKGLSPSALLADVVASPEQFASLAGVLVQYAHEGFGSGDNHHEQASDLIASVFSAALMRPDYSSMNLIDFSSIFAMRAQFSNWSFVSGD